VFVYVYANGQLSPHDILKCKHDESIIQCQIVGVNTNDMQHLILKPQFVDVEHG